MAKIGYIFNSIHYEGLDEDRRWMTQYGCNSIIEEQESQETLRPQWRQMLPRLTEGDELVVAKLSNAIRGTREFAVLMELCRIKGVRMISIRDHIDSGNMLFPDTTVGDVLNMVATLPTEVSWLRDAASQKRKLKGGQAMNPASVNKLERNKRVINMYKSGYSIDDIWEISGFSSRSSVFRVLRDANVSLRHKRI